MKDGMVMSMKQTKRIKQLQRVNSLDLINLETKEGQLDTISGHI